MLPLGELCAFAVTATIFEIIIKAKRASVFQQFKIQHRVKTYHISMQRNSTKEIETSIPLSPVPYRGASVEINSCGLTMLATQNATNTMEVVMSFLENPATLLLIRLSRIA